MVKNLPAHAGDAGHEGSIPGSERSQGVGNDNPLQSSCLENAMARGAWRATVHGVAKSWTQLSMHAPRGRWVEGRDRVWSGSVCTQVSALLQPRGAWRPWGGSGPGGRFPIAG